MKHKDFGHALREARVGRSLSVRAVEALTGISYTSISRYENENVDPSFLYMVLMCDLYAIDLDQIASIVRPASYQRDQHTGPLSKGQSMRSTTLGGALRAGRKAKRLSTRAVDDMTGVSHVNVSRYETGGSMPSFTAVAKMCDLYDIAIDDLANTLRHLERDAHQRKQFR